MAVMIQVQRVDPSEVRLTKDIDIMIHRSHLDCMKRAAQAHMLLPHGETKAKNAVHLVFSEERTSPKQTHPNRQSARRGSTSTAYPSPRSLSPTWIWWASSRPALSRNSRSTSKPASPESGKGTQLEPPARMGFGESKRALTLNGSQRYVVLEVGVEPT